MEAVRGSTLTASSLARGINTPGTVGVRECQFTLQCRLDDSSINRQMLGEWNCWTHINNHLTSLVTAPQCYDSILKKNSTVRNLSYVTMATHTGKGHVFAHCCICLVHDLHTVSNPVPRDEGVFHPMGSLHRMCGLCVVCGCGECGECVRTAPIKEFVCVSVCVCVCAFSGGGR